MKSKIEFDGINNVTVEYDDEITGERRATTYFVPYRGGYVRIRNSAGNFPQVCEGLSGTGNTLTASPETILNVIRREHRKRMNYWKRIEQYP